MVVVLHHYGGFNDVDHWNDHLNPGSGKTYFGLSRNGSYAAAKRGEIPTIKLGKLFRVPVRALEAMLDSALPPLAQV
jgi:hypothetical protein